MIENPYCLHRWEEVVNDIDMDNLTMLDKILFKTKEMSELGINDFQAFGAPCKYLNKLFGMTDEYRNFEYGVQSVSISGYDSGGWSARIPRIQVDYKKGNWKYNYVILVGENPPYFEKKDGACTTYCHAASERETQAIYDYLCQLIADRKAEIEKAKENPSVEEFANICLEYATSLMEEHPKQAARLTKGKCQCDSRESLAIVVEDKKIVKGYEPFCQHGHIKILGTSHGELYLDVSRPLCGSYTCDVNLDNYQEELKDAISFILN